MTTTGMPRRFAAATGGASAESSSGASTMPDTPREMNPSTSDTCAARSSSRSGPRQMMETPSSCAAFAVIPQGTPHVFWPSIHDGAATAPQERAVSILWRGPLREDDRAAQVSEVEGFISRGVSGIVLAPLDESALVGPVSDAMSRKSPVVIFDSGLKGDDNVKGGRMAGERIAQSLGGKGNVVLLRYAEGHDSTGKREQGFLEALAGH